MVSVLTLVGPWGVGVGSQYSLWSDRVGGGGVVSVLTLVRPSGGGVGGLLSGVVAALV